MQRFILIRFVQGLVVLVLLSIVVFLLGRFSGDPLDLMLPDTATKEDYVIMREILGLDKPLITQYGIFMGNALRGDLGKSLRDGRPVVEHLRTRLPNSVKLGGVTLLIALVLAMPMGIIAAVKKDTVLDFMVRSLAFLGQSTPSFWLGLMLMLVFGVRLGWLPTSGMDGPLHYLLPGFTMALFLLAAITRLLRSSMLEVLDSDYVTLARIKGVPERRVIYVHVLRNALIPVVTLGGFYVTTLISGAIVIETVFNWPGVGRLAYNAMVWRDYPLLQSIVLTIGAAVIMANLTVDVLYAYIDPRIRY